MASLKNGEHVFIPFDAEGKAFTGSGKIRIFRSIDNAAKAGFFDDCLVEYAPVRYAEWIDQDGKTWCSKCWASNKWYKPPFCPHCGAMMKAQQEAGRYADADTLQNA